MPPACPAGIHELPPHLGQRLRNAMFLPQSGQMMTSECDSSNFCSPSASRLFRNEARLVKVSSRDIRRARSNCTARAVSDSHHVELLVVQRVIRLEYEMNAHVA